MAPSGTAKPAFVPLEIKPVEFSLTAGTDIPDPLESPRSTPGRGPPSSRPEPPQPVSTNGLVTEAEANRDSGPVNGETHCRAESVATTNTKPGSTGSIPARSPTSTTDGSTANTTGSKRARRLFGFRSVSSSDALRSGRPSSPSNFIPSPGPRSRSGLGERRKSGGWFNKRASSFFTTVSEEHSNGDAVADYTREKTVPPPPKLPDLKKLGTELNDGSLGGDDMFKHIK